MRGVRTIKSRASVRSRERHGRLPAVVGVPPVKVYGPEISDGMYGNGYPVYNLYKTAPNLTIKALVGQWDDTDGETVLTSDFYTEYDEPLGATPTLIEGQLPGIELTITEAHIGKYIHVKTFASRGGVTTENVSMVVLEVQPVADTPEIGGYSTAPPQRFVGVNQPVLKPTFVWTAGALITPTVVTGEWYRNGVATGVTGELFPDPEAVNPLGRETAEGDMIRWQEQCTNAANLTGYSPGPVAAGLPDSYATLVTDLLPALRENMRSEIATRISGLPGGTASMDVYATAVHNTSSYVFNENNWAADLRYQLTAHCACQRFGAPNYASYSARYGFFLITPRHILTCAHIGPMTDQRYVRFFTHDNRLVEGRFTTQATVADGIANAFDDQIILLDRDMSELGVHVLPILNLQGEYAFRFYTNTETDRLPLLGVSQDGISHTPGAFEGTGNEELGIPKVHKRMLYIKLPRSHYSGFTRYPSEYDGYFYEPYKGDSGGPIMILAYGKFFVIGQHYDASMISSSVISDKSKQAIIDLIAAADAKAVAQGFLEAPTGLLPSFVTLDEVESFPVSNGDDLILTADGSSIQLADNSALSRYT